jgi:glycosyltransferase involved in cell wall biosynthesis
VKDGENGLLVPIDDVDALTYAIARVMSDRELCEKIIVGGHETYETSFTPAVMVDAYQKLFDRLHKG